MELQAVIGQLHMVEGVAQETDAVPGLLAQPAPGKAAHGRGRDSLFVHLSLTGPPAGGDSLLQDLLDTISSRFYDTRGSITAALRQAVIDANQQLLRLNMSGTGVDREGAITCAVLRGQELFVVQAGESFALIGRNFGVERLPDKEPDRITPLGRTAGLDFRFFHNWLEPGDMLFLADPRLAHVHGDTLEPALVESTVEESLPLLADAIGRETARVLLVEFTDEAPVDLPDGAITATTAPSPGRALRPPTQSPRRQTTAPTGDRLPRQVPSRSRPSLNLPRPALPDLPSGEDVEITARQAGSQAVLGLSRLTGWLAAFMNRLRPPRDATDDEDREGWAVPILIAVVIPILVAAIVTGVYVQRGRVVRISEIKQEMRQSLGLADQAGDETQARIHYNETLQLAAEAETLRPGDEEIQRLRLQAQNALDRIDDVTRLTPQLLHRYDGGSDVTRIVLRPGLNGDIFTLDGANNRVFLHETAEDYVTPTAEEPGEIIFGGQAVGPHVVGTLLDMIWRPVGAQVTQEGLAVVDDKGGVISYRPNFGDLAVTTLGLASDWSRPGAATQFNERLYVLDPGAAQMWRYFPEGDAFRIEEEQRALVLPDLGQAVDTTIYGEDGSVIVLYGDGRLRRYVNNSLLWDESGLMESGLNTPLIAPTRVKIIGSGLNSSVFVADPGSARIIQLSLGGTFLAQYKARNVDGVGELFSGLGDFAVAEAPLRIFVAAKDSLYITTQ